MALETILRSFRKMSDLAEGNDGLSWYFSGKCTYLHIIRNGVLTGRRYRDEILRPIVVPSIEAIGDDFILMDDNYRPHSANLVNDFLLEEGIIRIERPTCSLNMNQIEHA